LRRKSEAEGGHATVKEVQKCVGRNAHPPRLLRASEEFEAGWLIVQVQWYHYEKEHDRSNPSTRAYRLKPEKKWIVVNALLPKSRA
jgi:hypothetical protein